MAKLSLPNLGVIDYFERPGSPEEAYGAGVGKVRRTFDCDWNDRWLFAQGLLGWSEIKGEGDDAYISRTPPEPYREIFRQGPQDSRDSPSQYWLYPTSVDSINGIAPEPLNRSTDTGVYDRARLVVSYESVTYGIYSDNEVKSLQSELNEELRELPNVFPPTQPSDLVFQANPTYEATPYRYISRQFQPAAEYLTLPYGQLKWVDDGSPASNSVGKIIPTMEILYTWHQVPSKINNVASQVKKIYGLVGCVNQFKFDGCDPGTLLLTGVESRPYRQVGGGYLNDIVFKMKFFSATNQYGLPYTPARGHNYFLKFTSLGAFGINFLTGYEHVELSTDGFSTERRSGNRNVYDKVDFAQLFHP